MDFPRVLVVASIKFSQQAGGGVTMGHLLRGWPLDAIVQIHSDSFTEADHSVCTHYRYLPTPRIHATLLPPGPMLSLDRQIVGFVIGRRETLGHLVRVDGKLEWSRQFAPNVIYARPLGSPTFYWWLPRQLALALGTPYVVHIMDDWPARFEGRHGLLDNLVKWSARQESTEAI